jgi:hypothetical protein
LCVKTVLFMISWLGPEGALYVGDGWYDKPTMKRSPGNLILTGFGPSSTNSLYYKFVSVIISLTVKSSGMRNTNKLAPGVLASDFFIAIM